MLNERDNGRSKSDGAPSQKRAKNIERYNQLLYCKIDYFTATWKHSDAKEILIQRNSLKFEGEKRVEDKHRYRHERESCRQDAERQQEELQK